MTFRITVIERSGAEQAFPFRQRVCNAVAAQAASGGEVVSCVPDEAETKYTVTTRFS